MIGSPDGLSFGRSPSPFALTPELWLGNDEQQQTPALRRPTPWRSSDRLLEMIKTCHGSRIQQEQITRCTDPKYIQNIADQLIQSNALVEASLDKFGNYFIQALIGAVDERTLFKITAFLVTHDLVTEQVSKPITFCDLCMHSFGSHVVQVLISRAVENKAVSMKLVDGLMSNVAKLAVDFLGSICLVQAMKSLPTASRLVAGIAPLTRVLSQSRHGHTVVIEALDRASSQTLGLMEKELASDLEQVVHNDFSFRVLVHALEMEKAGKVSAKHSRVALFVSHLKYNQKCFRLIDFMLRNFVDHETVQFELIPKVVEIVKLGYVPNYI